MHRLPGRNFARYILMVYVLFCLILRSAYLGKQFEFMFKDIRPKDVETIEELIEKNFTIYADLEEISENSLFSTDIMKG
jgi:hypothetical protein